MQKLLFDTSKLIPYFHKVSLSVICFQNVKDKLNQVVRSTGQSLSSGMFVISYEKI